MKGEEGMWPHVVCTLERSLRLLVEMEWSR